ncbi:glycerate kinase [bacterium]|nr:glycerate kinase [candidate division CSSED10-310 bacterium]
MRPESFRILVAPAAFKGTLTAAQVAAAMTAGCRAALPGAVIKSIPLADGGAGTVACLVAAIGGVMHEVVVRGPVGASVSAVFGLSGDGREAFVETAAAAGLALLDGRAGNPLATSTYGVGQLVRAALRHGPERLIIGLGDSATNDGGAGLLQALGCQFLDVAGLELSSPLTGGGLALVHDVLATGLDSALEGCHVTAATDVDNPLLGAQGCARMYGPQKGAGPAAVERLEMGMARYADVLERRFMVDYRNRPGAGAAGGMGFGLMVVLRAERRSGIDLVLQRTGFRDLLRGVDLVLTGEGRVDAQTARGKVVAGVTAAARETGTRVIAVVGQAEPGMDAGELGLDRLVVLGGEPDPLHAAARVTLAVRRALA